MRKVNRIGFACMAFLCSVVPAVADTFTNTPTFQEFQLTGVPDFDQVRGSANVVIDDSTYTVLGLPNTGDEYCVPTSATDWTAFLQSRGYTNLPPGPGPFETGYISGGVPGLDRYNAIDLSIYSMGLSMGTNPTSGTYGGARQGFQNVLSASYPGDLVVVSNYREGGYIPRSTDIVATGLVGWLPQFVGGWYQTMTYGGKTVYYRDGGHSTAIPQASQAAGFSVVDLWMCNPDAGTGNDITQSTFSYDFHYTWPINVSIIDVDQYGAPIAGTEYSYTCDEVSTVQSATWIFDQLFTVIPFFGYTVSDDQITMLNPLAFLNKDAYPNGISTMTSMDGSAITSVSVQPTSARFYYTTANGGNHLFWTNPVTHKTAFVASQASIRQVLCSADMSPYVLFGTGSIGRLNPASGEINVIKTLEKVDRLVLDPVADELVALNFSGRTATYVDRHGDTITTEQLPAVQSVADTMVDVGANEHIYIAEKSNKTMFEVGGPELVSHAIPDVATASTFAIDDWGRVFLSINGKIKVENLEGQGVSTKFEGMSAGPMLSMIRGTDNFEKGINDLPEWRDVLPPAGTF